MIVNLPPQGARARALGYPWQETEYLLAGVIDAVNQSTAVAIAAAGAGYKKPKRVQRPGEEEPGKIGGRGSLSSMDAIKRLRTLQSPTPEQASALERLEVKGG